MFGHVKNVIQPGRSFLDENRPPPMHQLCRHLAARQ